MAVKGQAAVKKIRAARRRESDMEQLAMEIREGNTIALARAITLVESNASREREQAEELLRKLLPFSGKSIRIGISGVPGAGKSTFIEAFGMYLTGIGRKVAVLAVDPSSQAGKGSILGDKTRMNELAADPRAFIRPSPSSGMLGGVAGKTRETIFLCEAAEFDTILVETVGVGQSETEVRSMVDFFILLAIAGAGDELQGIKRGIMEMADLVLVNKADGDNAARAKAARQEIGRALHFFPELPSGWTPVAATCSSLEKTGISEAWQTVEKYLEHSRINGYFEQNRQDQLIRWLQESIRQELTTAFFGHPEVKKMLPEIKARIRENTLSVSEAVKVLMALFR